MAEVQEGKLLWEPPAALKEQSNITRYMAWLEREQGLRFDTYDELWRWSVENIEPFWESIWRFYSVQSHSPYSAVLADARMPGAKWFPGARINYAEHIFRSRTGDYPAIIAESELRPLTEISWDELARQVAAVATALRQMGVGTGDRVVAYIANIPEAVVAALAAASIGAVWSSTSPDFGATAVADRFRQIEPKVLFAVDGYSYGGKHFDTRGVVAQLQAALPTLEKTVLIPYLRPDQGLGELANTVLWTDLVARAGSGAGAAPGAGAGASAGGPAAPELTFTPVPFDHPLWVLYSSGTTGLPKPIVHGHGGILLEHFKILGLHQDLKPGDRFFWFTTTGWMMWNYLLSGLLVGATILLYDGSPGYPDMNRLWAFAEKTRMNLFGTSAAYLTACMKAGIEPGRRFDLSGLKSIGSTGSPLPPEGFQWCYEQVKPDIWVASVSGGTDLCTAFVAGAPILPVHAGELQCRCLGARVEAFDPEGRPLIDAVGELVITRPMPSMPIYFWNDPDYSRYRASYFEAYPGIWRHGDWIKITPRGSAVIYGRSDATINRHGVRMGTSEIYRVVEAVPEVLDSLVVDVAGPGADTTMLLFVVLREGATLDPALQQQIKGRIRSELSPRHVPDQIVAVRAVPRTLNGKKLEVPVKKMLMGAPPEKAVNPASVNDPQALTELLRVAREVMDGAG